MPSLAIFLARFHVPTLLHNAGVRVCYLVSDSPK